MISRRKTAKHFALTIIVGRWRRHRWRVAEKFRILAEANEPGARSERSSRLLDQMELHLEELEATATKMNSRPRRKRPGSPRSTASAASVRPASRSPPTAAGAHRCVRSSGLPMLRRSTAVEVGRGRYRDVGGHPAALEGDPARARDGLLPTARASASRRPTLANQIGACCAVLEPVFKRIEAHVFADGRLHGDDTTVPVLTAGKTDIARIWVYVRDDRPFAGPACATTARPSAITCIRRSQSMPTAVRCWASSRSAF